MKFLLLLLTVIVFAASSGFAVAAPDAGAPALKRGITNDQKKPSTHDVNKSGAYKKAVTVAAQRTKETQTQGS